ncbi:MAG: hypothetical protein A2219_08850 [Elusimicrobia bacterium RIFOXYA2_FULL_50_26]|nr:MAG: hypothetical protein A2219_08850 [Elusimicrobia bacterium RIFOXYA2_FULL_50_26]OGS24173.1 MAG: hypothetical protein A2314_01845 [Elusimicrobia bacterium RIFOXYB2_FULL_50_12]
MEERRKHKRYPVLHEIDQPIQVALDGKALPGVLVELSAGGMAILTFTSIPVGTEMALSLDLPGLRTQELSGRVVWSLLKGEMWRLGIVFKKINPVDFRHINRMAFDYSDCATKLALGVSDVCSDKCSYHMLCQKVERTNGRHKSAY